MKRTIDVSGRGHVVRPKRYPEIQDRYFVYPETGIVTCVITGTRRAALIDFVEMTDISFNATESMYLKDKYVGTAKCDLEKDKFDELLGKDLAFERAYAQYIADKKTAMHNICNYISGKISNVERVLSISKKYNKKYKDLPRFKEIFRIDEDDE